MGILGERIMVDRGWIPQGQMHKETRLEGQIEGDTGLTGHVRLTDTDEDEPWKKFYQKRFEEFSKIFTTSGNSKFFVLKEFEGHVRPIEHAPGLPGSHGGLICARRTDRRTDENLDEERAYAIRHHVVGFVPRDDINVDQQIHYQIEIFILFLQ